MSVAKFVANFIRQWAKKITGGADNSRLGSHEWDDHCRQANKSSESLYVRIKTHSAIIKSTIIILYKTKFLRQKIIIKKTGCFLHSIFFFKTRSKNDGICPWGISRGDRILAPMQLYEESLWKKSAEYFVRYVLTIENGISRISRGFGPFEPLNMNTLFRFTRE